MPTGRPRVFKRKKLTDSSSLKLLVHTAIKIHYASGRTHPPPPPSLPRFEPKPTQPRTLVGRPQPLINGIGFSLCSRYQSRTARRAHTAFVLVRTCVCTVKTQQLLPGNNSGVRCFSKIVKAPTARTPSRKSREEPARKEQLHPDEERTKQQWGVRVKLKSSRRQGRQTATQPMPGQRVTGKPTMRLSNQPSGR